MKLSIFCKLLIANSGVVLSLVACNQGGTDVQATPTPLPTPVTPEKPTYIVERGTVVNALQFIGRVSPVKEQELFFKRDGFVAEVFYARGDIVEENERLAEMEITDLQNQLAQQQVALETAEVNLNNAEQSLEDQLFEARINLEKLQIQIEQDQASKGTSQFVAAQVGLQAAERRLAEAQEFYDNAWDPARDWEGYMIDPSCLPGQGGPIPCTGQPLSKQLEGDREGSERSLAQAQENLTVAQAEYNDAYAATGLGIFDAQILEKDAELAEHKIEQLERGVDPLLALDVERVRLEIADTERQITDARLVAPFGGEILSMGVRPGDLAEAFKTVLVLADPSQLEVTAELGAEEMSEMSVGQPATITLRSRPDKEFSGSVRQMPYPFGGGAVDGVGDAAGEDTAVRISFDDPGVDLELGELATVVISLEEKQDALWLPPAAIRTFQGRDFVVVQDEEGQRRVDVRLGIESDDRVEILEGLEAEQIVVGE
jgi:multidrug efflux pump subunit AcrA (membrane-fusion protein)